MLASASQGVSAPKGGVCSQGVSAPGGSGPRQVSAPRRGVSAPRMVVSAPRGSLVLGVSVLGGVCSGGCLVPWGGESAPGGDVWSRGSAPGGVFQHALRKTPPPPPWTESQTPVKTLPWPNFVAAGNKNYSHTNE